MSFTSGAPVPMHLRARRSRPNAVPPPAPFVRRATRSTERAAQWPPYSASTPDADGMLPPSSPKRLEETFRALLQNAGYSPRRSGARTETRRTHRLRRLRPPARDIERGVRERFDSRVALAIEHAELRPAAGFEARATPRARVGAARRHARVGDTGGARDGLPPDGRAIARCRREDEGFVLTHGRVDSRFVPREGDPIGCGTCRISGLLVASKDGCFRPRSPWRRLPTLTSRGVP